MRCSSLVRSNPWDGMPLVIQHDERRPIASVGDGLALTHTDAELRISSVSYAMAQPS